MQQEKICLVTGASGGIGRAISRELASAGYTVILQGRDLDKLTDIRNMIQEEVSYFEIQLVLTGIYKK